MINMERTGRTIAEAREKAGMTQKQLAEQIGVSPQAVSKWEHGANLPDVDNLLRIAECTNTPYALFLGPQDKAELPLSLQFRPRLFQEENMFTRLRAFALAEHLQESYKALAFMRQQHMGQYRKQRRYSPELVQYINHPLTMACHAHAMGLRDDPLLAAILLHDVVEDTGVKQEELPFSEEVRELVGLVSFQTPEGMSKPQTRQAYYERIGRNGKACLIKIIDRCSNLSEMAGAFSREKLIEYLEETEQFVLPLAEILKNEYPEYNDAAFLVKYQIISLLETVKHLLV